MFSNQQPQEVHLSDPYALPVRRCVNCGFIIEEDEARSRHLGSSTSENPFTVTFRHSKVSDCQKAKAKRKPQANGDA